LFALVLHADNPIACPPDSYVRIVSVLREDIALDTELAELGSYFQNVYPLFRFLPSLLIVSRLPPPCTVIQVVLRFVPIEMRSPLTMTRNLGSGNQVERMIQVLYK
jgi:hypothetical protein